jgi:hypothetical protein
VFDKVVKSSAASKLQARYFAYNLDGGGSIEVDGPQFRTRRPGAMMEGVAFAPRGAVARTDLLPLPEERAKQYPFAEVETAASSLTPALLTVLLPVPPGSAATADVAEVEEGVFAVDILHGDHSAQVRFFDTGTIPEFEVG